MHCVSRCINNRTSIFIINVAGGRFWRTSLSSIHFINILNGEQCSCLVQWTTNCLYWDKSILITNVNISSFDKNCKQFACLCTRVCNWLSTDAQPNSVDSRRTNVVTLFQNRGPRVNRKLPAPAAFRCNLSIQSICISEYLLNLHYPLLRPFTIPTALCDVYRTQSGRSNKGL